MKRAAAVLVMLLVFGVGGAANAALTTIGSAGYDSDGSGIIDADEHYKLIWDDDNNGNSVVWLDYSKHRNTWYN